MFRATALAACLSTLVLAMPAHAQVATGYGSVGYGYGNFGAFDAFDVERVGNAEPVGAPIGSYSARGGMGSLPGTGAGASMDAFGRLSLPGGNGCVGCE